MPTPIKVLILEDDPDDAALMELQLQRAGFEPTCTCVYDEAGFLAGLEQAPDLVLSDFSLPQFDGLRALARLRERDQDMPFILVSGSLGEEQAVAAMRNGASDYLLKDRLTRLGQAVVQALAQSRLRKERATLADTLHKAETRFRRLFENTVEGIFQCTLDGHFLMANPAMARITGFDTPEELMQSFPDLESRLAKDPFQHPKILQELLTQGQIKAREIQIRRKDGSLSWASINLILAVDEATGEQHVDGTMEDISERKGLEAQLLRVQRLESLGRLSGGIAHDLNNLLSPMLMAPPLLREQLSDEASLKLLDAIESSARRGADIIRQLLTFSRGTEGPMQPVELGSMLHDIVGIIRETFPKSITLQQECEDALPCVMGDPTQLEQVVMNLCVNARDAMPQGGLLRLGASTSRITEQLAAVNPAARPGPAVLLHVTDTGTGISPEHFDTIFDPFFTTKKLGEGTGLGLSTVLGIVKSHKGAIQVNSTVGVGTQFQIYLPIPSSRPLN